MLSVSNVRLDLARAAWTRPRSTVCIATFNVIYDAIERVRQLLEGMLAPIVEEHVLGHAV
ncbi:MAG: hypothetical protein R3E66_20405 [bacterium]